MNNNHPKNHRPDECRLNFSTGIQELDRLLGLEGKKQGSAKANNEINTDTISLLIRGGQGAGKTTLALQILSNQLLARNQQSANYGLFLSLERSAGEALAYVHDNFNLFKSNRPADAGRTAKFSIYESGAKKVSRPGDVVGVEGEFFKQMVAKSFQAEDKTKLDRLAVSFLTILSALEIPGVKADNALKVFEDQKANSNKQHTETFQNDLAAGLIEFIDIPKLDDNGTLWVVIDSLNVLERIIYQRSETEQYRAAIQGLATALKAKLKENKKPGVKIVIMFTGEYHTPSLDVSGASGESFFCDVEILLAQEPIIGKARTDPRNSAAAGYNVELHHSPHGVDAEGWNKRIVVETRAFCRVLKSRFTKNQSRRCFYKMRPGIGMHFDEAFPGDGYLLLFEDNPKQRKDWEELLLKDAPLEFPALRYEIFDRTSQQRVFSTERCFRSQRQDTDLHLASLDTYWIKWFLELNQRLVIGEHLSELRRTIKGQHADERKATQLYCHAVCKVHKVFIEAQDAGEKPDFKALKQEVSALTKASWIDDQVADDEFWERFLKCDGMLKPILHKSLRLFGEQRSDLLEDLQKHNKHIHQMSDANENTLSSIPFNANVSFLVFRKDLLDSLIHKENAKIYDNLKDLLKRERQEIHRFITSYWPAALADVKNIRNDQGKEPFAIPIDENAEEKLCRVLTDSLVAGRLPTTWEEVIAICKAGQMDLVIETNSFDTLLCTFLEFVWGCGADIVVDAEYTVKMSQNNLARLYQAIFLLQELLRAAKDTGYSVIPPSSTLEAQAFGKRYSKNPNERNGKKQDWIFMRQWHSTFVDILVAAKDSPAREFHWQPDGKPELEIIPLPKSIWQIASQNAFTEADMTDAATITAKLSSVKEASRGVSCWGEWHLAVMQGSENDKLAVGLLNNLMSSHKISNRALSGAALPAVADFYTIYKDTPCVLLPERSGEVGLPKLTYGQLRSDIFSCAKSRLAIFDYRHCMREFHGFLTSLIHDPDMDAKIIANNLAGVFKRISELRDRELMLH